MALVVKAQTQVPAPTQAKAPQKGRLYDSLHYKQRLHSFNVGDKVLYTGKTPIKAIVKAIKDLGDDRSGVEIETETGDIRTASPFKLEVMEKAVNRKSA
jgi:hypothetical protein